MIGIIEEVKVREILISGARLSRVSQENRYAERIYSDAEFECLATD